MASPEAVVCPQGVSALFAEASAEIDRSVGRLSATWAPDAPPRLLEAMAYSLNAGGKRVRPALVLQTARACGASLEGISPAVSKAMFAVELVHTFSLVHDDLPAMDDDDLRRGVPTNHRVFGEAMAILAGDAMLAMAFEVLTRDIEPALAASLVVELSKATGATGMVGGQVMDIDSERKTLTMEELVAMHEAKTGALLVGSCRMGALAAGASPDRLAAVTEYARHLGLAFQIVDDLLDVTATPEQMGKATGKDQARGKNTYPRLLGVSATQAAARKASADAVAAIVPLGASGAVLRELALYIGDRDR